MCLREAAKMANKSINPINPNQGRILKKSPILSSTNRAAKEKANKETMKPALGENLKNIGKSITPTVRSKPYGEY
jgi:hypothetical protein